MSETVIAGEKPRKSGWLRATAAVIVFVLALLLTPLALVGHWGHQTISNTDNFVATVGPLIEQPEVQQAITTAATNAIVSQVNTTSLVSGVLDNLIKNPTLNQALTAPISTGIDSLIETGVGKVVSSDAFASAWVGLATAIQKSVMLILEGKPGDIVTLQGDQVVLDMTPLLKGVQQAIVAKGFTIADKVTIPDHTATYVLFTSPALAQLRFIYGFTAPILEFFPLLLAALFALSLWLSRRRGAMAVAIGVGFAAMVELTKIGLDIGQGIFVDQLQGTILAPVSTVFWSTFFNYLEIGFRANMILAVSILIAGLLSLNARWSVTSRRFLASGPEYAGARIGLGSVGSIIGRNAHGFRVGALIASVLILTPIGDILSIGHVIWTILLAAGLFTAIQVCVGSAEAADSKTVEIDEGVVELDVPLS